MLYQALQATFPQLPALEQLIGATEECGGRCLETDGETELDGDLARSYFDTHYYIKLPISPPAPLTSITLKVAPGWYNPQERHHTGVYTVTAQGDFDAALVAQVLKGLNDQDIENIGMEFNPTAPTTGQSYSEWLNAIVRG